ncbi:MAG: PH domain-containing protein [Opitutales bacterium]|nr:PH domain-containing protein [Opitutales bacterium]
MIRRLEAILLRVLRVPPDPAPPAGAPGSLRIFRAGRNFWFLRLVEWTGKQLIAVLGILVSVALIQEAAWQHAAAEVVETAGEMISEEAPILPERRGVTSLTGRFAPAFFINIAASIPPRLLFWMRVVEGFAIAGFLLQLPVTLLLNRLDYEYRWYLVTDRSLRLREGLVSVHESTMSFANLQQVELRQGPLERLLGLADVRVCSAGGGGDSSGKNDEAGHQSLFRAVDNAPEIRDFILERLRRYRAAGLGDKDDPDIPPVGGPSSAVESATLAAARELSAAARDLRREFCG